MFIITERFKPVGGHEVTFISTGVSLLQLFAAPSACIGMSTLLFHKYHSSSTSSSLSQYPTLQHSSIYFLMLYYNLKKTSFSITFSSTCSFASVSILLLLLALYYLKNTFSITFSSSFATFSIQLVLVNLQINHISNASICFSLPCFGNHIMPLAQCHVSKQK